MQKRTLNESIDKQDAGWSRVHEWLKQAANLVEVLAADENARTTALLETQVTSS